MMQWTDLQALAPVPDCGPDFNACLDAFPDLHALRNTPQSARWHAEGDCWIHTQLVVRALIDGTDYAALPRREGCYDRPRAFADAHTAVSYFRGANVHPDFPLYPESGSQVIVMSGLPASGKNRWVATHHPNVPVVSYDDTRAELRLRHGKAEGKIAHHTLDKAKELLRAQAPFVWNATHIGSQLRMKALDLCYAYNAEVAIESLEAPRAELLRRNDRRDTSLTNKALLGMLHRWEVPAHTEAHAVRYIGLSQSG